MSDAIFSISLFDKALHDRSAFCCGVDALDNWLKKTVTQKIRDNRLRLWCAIDNDGMLAGFYAMNPHAISVENAGSLVVKGDRYEIPVMYLSCVAVSTIHQGQGLGEALVTHAMERALTISYSVPVSAIILDVLDDKDTAKRMNFYVSKMKFSKISENSLKLFINIKDIKVNIENANNIPS
jgi:ribosomal protein S18 acetylase RimI-like enzyme